MRRNSDCKQFIRASAASMYSISKLEASHSPAATGSACQTCRYRYILSRASIASLAGRACLFYVQLLEGYMLHYSTTANVPGYIETMIPCSTIDHAIVTKSARSSLLSSDCFTLLKGNLLFRLFFNSCRNSLRLGYLNGGRSPSRRAPIRSQTLIDTVRSA